MALRTGQAGQGEPPYLRRLCVLILPGLLSLKLRCQDRAQEPNQAQMGPAGWAMSLTRFGSPLVLFFSFPF